MYRFVSVLLCLLMAASPAFAVPKKKKQKPAARQEAPREEKDPIQKLLETALKDPHVYEALKMAHDQETSVDIKLVDDEAGKGEFTEAVPTQATAEPTPGTLEEAPVPEETPAEMKPVDEPAATTPAEPAKPNDAPKTTPVAPTTGSQPSAQLPATKQEYEQFQAMEASEFNKGFQGKTIEKKKEEKLYNYLGAMLDIGLPDGIALSFVFRPWHWLRVYVSGNHNLVSFGLRGGLTVVPFKGPVSPSATFEAGHQFEGDANWIVQKIINDATFQNASLKRVSYNYVNGHLGLEFGTNNFTFFIHGGISYISGTIHDFQKTLEETSPTTSSLVRASDPTFYFLGPSGKLGAVYYFW